MRPRLTRDTIGLRRAKEKIDHEKAWDAGGGDVGGSGVALAEEVTCDVTPPCYGTPERDYIVGISLEETIYAYGDNDIVYASGANDTVYGSLGNDSLYGEGGSDKGYGGGGGDSIYADFHDTSGSTDYSYGGGGNDTVYALDSNKDIINCGKGTADYVRYDASLDTLTACENKNAY